MVRCVDKSLYTGITTDVTRRVEKHNSGKGSKYCRNRRPVALVYSKEIGAKSAALKREYALKQLTREEKEELIK